MGADWRILPFILDNQKHLNSLFTRLKKIPVDFIIPASLTLRPGRQKNLFLEIINKNFPDLTPQYKQIYENESASGAPVKNYLPMIYERMKKTLSEMEVPFRIPHTVFRNILNLPDEIFILLNHMVNIYRRTGIPTDPLEYSLSCFKNWLLNERRFFNRQRSLPSNFLETQLLAIINKQALNKIIENQKIILFPH